MKMTAFSRRGRLGAVIAAVLALTLVAVGAESASAKTGDFGILKSSDKHATADSNYSGPGVEWYSGLRATVKGTLYDTSADGKGATLRAYINFYDSAGRILGQSGDEERELDGAGTHRAVELRIPWMEGASKGTIFVFVCNGKGSLNTNINCGSSYSMSV